MENFDDQVSKRFDGMESQLPPAGWARLERGIWIAKWQPRIIYGLVGLILMIGVYMGGRELAPRSVASTHPDIERVNESGQTPARGLPPAITQEANQDNTDYQVATQANTPPSADAHPSASSHEAQHHDGGSTIAFDNTGQSPTHPIIKKRTFKAPRYPAKVKWGGWIGKIPMGSFGKSKATDISYISPEEKIPDTWVSLGGQYDRLAIAHGQMPEWELKTTLLCLQVPMFRNRYIELTVSPRIANKIAKPIDQEMYWQMDNANELYSERVGYEVSLQMGSEILRKKEGKTGSYAQRSSFNWNVGISLLNMNEQISYTVIEQVPQMHQSQYHDTNSMSISPQSSQQITMNASLYYATIKTGFEYYMGKSRNVFVSGGGGVGHYLEGLSTVEGQDQLTINQLNPYGYIGAGVLVRSPISRGLGHIMKVGPSIHYYPSEISGGLDINTMTFGLDLTIRKYK